MVLFAKDAGIATIQAFIYLLQAFRNEDDGCQFAEEAVKGFALSTRSCKRQPTSARRLRGNRSATQRYEGDKHIIESL